jgi:hypothetical protein
MHSRCSSFCLKPTLKAVVFGVMFKKTDEKRKNNREYTFNFANKYRISPYILIFCQNQPLYIASLCNLQNEMRPLCCKIRDPVVQ